MVLTKQYLRYCPSSKFNIISSSNCDIKFVVYEGQEGRYVAVGACEDIIIWDLRLGEKAAVLAGEKEAVTCIAPSPNKWILAAGCEDGSIKLYNLKNCEHTATFDGHRSAVTCLSFDAEGHRLTSGSKDSDIIIWDIVAECGIHRLCGHKNVVTQVKFLNQYNVLVSSSKDSFIKFWDLDTAHCFKTLVGHRSEIWGFCLMKNESYLVTGCSDNELRVWEIKAVDPDGVKGHMDEVETGIVQESDDNYKSPFSCKYVGSVLRSNKGRVYGIVADESGQVLASIGLDYKVELFVFHAEKEARERLRKRIKKLRKKTPLNPNENNNEFSTATKEENPEMGEDIKKDPLSTETRLSLVDEVQRLHPVAASSRVKSCSIVMGRSGEMRLAVSLKTNCIELSSISAPKKDAEVILLRKISHQGHRSIARSVAFSSDNLAVVSGSGESVKLWNRSSQKCLQTVEVGYVVCVRFVPGDRHVLVGLKDGSLLIVDVAAGDILEKIPAHTAELWSICVYPDQHGCVSGGGDKAVKFWNFELISDPNKESKARVLSLLHKRTLKVEESVLDVKMSPNNRLIALALLDCTVKIFFVDTLKFFLSLYGHKLPITSMDISYDSTLIVTGSADRNIKIWGLDFGDCHKSIFAHDDSIMSIQFVPKTHQIFSCGKDGRVKQWDGDTFDKILTLQGHHGEACALAVSPSGEYVVSTGTDCVLRLFERTMEPLVLQDQEEDEREEAERAEVATGDVTVVKGLGIPNLPSKKTVGSENIAEKILECLEVGKLYTEQLTEHSEVCKESGQAMALPPVPVLMKAYNVKNAEEFLLETLKTVRASDIEEALLILPFTAVCELLTLLPRVIALGSNIELLTKVMMFLLKIHHKPIVGCPTLAPVILELKKLSFDKINEYRDTVGVNYHGMLCIQRQLEEKEGVMLFKEALMDKRMKDRKRKKREKIRTYKAIAL